jgi:DNA (cytosine-5)-methyltransferase 1
MRSVDLFSGIGGLTLALKPFSTPVLYCEIEAFCTSVLVARMRDGKVPRAPIHADVRTLHVEALEPKLVVAGFPCQDVSSLGARTGMRGRRSSLVFEVMRLVDESPSIVAVFLENVSNIATCGGEEIVRALAARGFLARWTMRAACDEGAPHVRLRWFLLACRGEGAASVASSVSDAEESMQREWPVEPAISVLPREEQGKNWVRRMSALGNAVVPCVARRAFVDLARSAPAWREFSSMLEGTPIGSELPRNAMLVDSKVYTIQGPSPVRTARYPTPRSANVYPTLPSETRSDTLSTVLVSAAGGQHLAFLPDPKYVEWVMGFEPDWTLVAEDEPPSRQPQADAATEEDGRTDEAPSRPRKKLNGMHMLMREFPGITISATSTMWRGLPADRRAAYTAAARLQDVEVQA